MTAAQVLIYAVAGVPLVLSALALWPAARPALIHTLPLAPLPGLAAALLVPEGALEPLPRTLLGAALVLDAPGRLFLGISALLWVLAGVYARATISGEGRERFAGFWLATLSGNMLLFIAGHVVSFYLAFAILSLAAFGLVVHKGSDEARRAARIYLALAIFGETLLLMGLLLAVSGTDSILVAEVRAALPTLPHRDLTLALLVAGFGLKAGLIPLHVWLPLAHPAAPVAASAVLSGAIVKAGIFGLVRFLPLEADLPGWSDALVALGLATTYYGAAMGVCQHRPKTVLAYSTLSQMGLVTVVLGSGFEPMNAPPGAGPPGAGSAIALAAAGLYAAHHGLAKGALFLSVGVLHDSGGRARAIMLAATGIIALAIAGLPFTGGAFAKLAIKGPLGTGAASILVTVSAVGTTLLMLRFLHLIARERGRAESLPAPGQWLSFLFCGAAALAVPLALFPRLSGLTWGYALGPGNLWGAAWPILIGLALVLVARRRRLSPPPIPEGDIIVLAERLFIRLEALARRPRAPEWSLAPLERHAGRMGEWLRKAEGRLGQWSIAGLLLLAAALASSALILHAS